MAEKEYIEREVLVDHLENAKEILWHDISLSSIYAAKLVDIFLACVKVFPAADVAPVRHGVWASEETAVTCTACGRSYDTDFEIKRNVISNFDYCPNCGAKMDGDKNG